MAVVYPTIHEVKTLTDLKDFATGSAMDSGGLGTLSDMLSCVVTEERNGEYSLEAIYPIDGALADELKIGNILMVKNSPVAEYTQPFQIINVQKDIYGNLTATAEHISFALRYVPIEAFSYTGSVKNVIERFGSASKAYPPGSYFIYTTDINATMTYTIETPTNVRAALIEDSGSVSHVIGGSMGVSAVLDRFNVKLTQSAGEDRSDFVVEYGYNMSDYSESAVRDSAIDGVRGYYKNGEGAFMYSNLQATSDRDTNAANAIYRYVWVDLQNQFSSTPTTAQMDAAAKNYATTNYKSLPPVSFTVSFEEAAMSPGVKMPKVNDHIRVVFPKYGIDTTSYISGAKYNVLTDRYDEITVGERKLTTYEILNRR